MKTLVIIAHPDYQNSMGQQFLKESIKDEDTITSYHLDESSIDGQVDSPKSLELIATHDRIVFQFPLHWYGAPALLKQWQDTVLSQAKQGVLKGKELGLVVSVGVQKNDYRPGGAVGLTLEQLFSPYQALATYFSMSYLPHFAIHQFAYMTEAQKQKLLVDYQYYLTGPSQSTLNQKTSWLLAKLADSDHQNHEKLSLLKEALSNNQETIADLTQTLAEMTEEER